MDDENEVFAFTSFDLPVNFVKAQVSRVQKTDIWCALSHSGNVLFKNRWVLNLYHEELVSATQSIQGNGPDSPGTKFRESFLLLLKYFTNVLVLSAESVTAMRSSHLSKAKDRFLFTTL